MKSLHKKLIQRWQFQLFPDERICKQVSYETAIRVAQELHASGNQYDNPQLRRLLIPRNELQAAIDMILHPPAPGTPRWSRFRFMR